MTARPIIKLPDRDIAASLVAAVIEGSLRQSIALSGHAELWLSGGSTPGPVFERLSGAPLPWRSVKIGLVDDRFVPDDGPRSNAHLVRQSLIRNAAAHPSDFLPMVTGGIAPDADAAAADDAYKAGFESRPTVLLGMGVDGHTASWFPSVPDLDTVTSPDNPAWVVAVDASGSEVAGDTPRRLTLTGRALSRAALAILFITGDDKRRVLSDRSMQLPIHRAEDLLGDRLMVVWAP